MQIIREKTHHEDVFYNIHYRVKGKSYGWSFPCDKQGNVDIDSLCEPALVNLTKCIRGRDEETGEEIECTGVEKHVSCWVEPAVGLCECGCEVELGHFTCTCEGCGTDYNWAGQRLAPRECWGEETGEHPADIARIQ